MPPSPHHSETRSDFIEKVGLISQAEGLPRIAGRIFGTLVFDGSIVSFGDLAEMLQVSRASVSTSVRLLEERGLIKRIAKPGERQDYFQLSPNPYATMIEGAQKRIRSAKADIVDTIGQLPADAAPLGRLKDYAAFYGSIENSLGDALNNLRTQQAPSPCQPDTPEVDQ